MKKTTFAVTFLSALLIFTIAETLMANFGFADTEANYDWPMHQHDLTRSGYSSSNAPYTNVTLWSYPTHSAYSSPAVADGKVFIGNISGWVSCLDAMTGALTWTFNTNQNDQYSIPSIINEKLYIAVGAVVYCLNASSGSLIWNYTTGLGIMGSCPAVVDERVYVGSPDNNTYCLDAATGNLIWNFSAERFVWSSPLVANGMVYFGSHDYNVYALNASNGEKIWSFKTGLFVDNSPGISDGKIYIGSSDGRFYCLDAFTGSLIWSRKTGDRINSAAALVNGKVYFGSDDNKTYCLDAKTGAVLWTYTTDGHIHSAAAVADGKVYIGSGDHKIYCLDADAGWLVWSYDTGDYVGMSPAIANGIVYIGSFSRLYAFVGSPDSPAPTPPLTPTPKPSPTSMPTTTPTHKPTPSPTNRPIPPSPKPTSSLYDNQFQIQSNSTVSALFFNSTNSEITFTVNGTTGTTGYVRATISKSLMPNDENIKVYLDGNPISYSITSNGDWWVMTFTYQHSMHQVKINQQEQASGSATASSNYLLYIALGVIAALLGFLGLIVWLARFEKSSSGSTAVAL